MFDEKTLRELASLEANGPILSVYLDVDSTQHSAEEYKLILREMLKHVDGQANHEDVEAVKRYVDLAYDWSGRGLALFSRTDEDLWYAFTLAVPVSSGVTVAAKPYISPLVELNGLYGRYVVALVDRQGGRFFLFEMGHLVDQEGTVGEDIRRVRKGRGSSVVGMRGGAPASGRKEAELVQRNLKDCATALSHFCQRHHPRQLLLAGAEHTIAQFQEYLPGALKDVVVGAFAADMDAKEGEIQERAFIILAELMAARKQSVIEATVTAAAKGQNGALGLEETLHVAHEGRVQVLVVEQHYHAPGYRCAGCGYLTTQPQGACSFCNGTFTEIPDAVEAVVSQVVEKGGTVEVIDSHMMMNAHIGALLRY
ncbi:MAG TPA: hypothetical protein PKH77_04755 [Anaerolineae bacterium]|nr:hypothetical protein [Anaerolineae bacterium]